MNVIDEIDLKILEYYMKDHRIRASELSSLLGISRGTLRSRIHKLINQDILKGFISIVDPRGLGFNVTAFFFLKTNPHESWLLEKIMALPNCDFVAGISGTFSLLCRFRLRDDHAFGSVMYNIDSLMARSGSRTYRVIRVVDIFKENDVIVEKGPIRMIDEKDFPLLERLAYQTCSSDQYTPLSSLQLASETSLSQPTVYNRLKRLENNRILIGFGIDVNWSHVNGDWIGFVIQIKVAFDKITEVAKLLAQLSEVRSLYRTTEEYLLFGFIWVQNITEFNKFLLKCYDIPGVEDTQSLLMLDVHLERSPVTVLKSIQINE